MQSALPLPTCSPLFFLFLCVELSSPISITHSPPHQVLVGNTYPKAVISDIYFFKLNLADIIPTSVPNASLINSIAQSIGLHDFYQVGLWTFCEGYERVYVPSPPPHLRPSWLTHCSAE